MPPLLLKGFNFEEAVAEEVLTIEQEAEVETEDGNGGQDDTVGSDDDEDLPTTEQVHATMQQFHLRKCQPAQDDAARRAKSARIRRRNKCGKSSKETSCILKYVSVFPSPLQGITGARRCGARTLCACAQRSRCAPISARSSGALEHSRTAGHQQDTGQEEIRPFF